MIKGSMAALGLVAGTGAALAQSTGMSGDALRQTISGRTIVLSTPVGGLPITYQPDGTLSGQANGLQVLAGAGPKQDTGRWWINANQVCQQWKVWLDSRKYCYEMRIDGQKVHWRRNDGRSGVAAIASK